MKPSDFERVEVRLRGEPAGAPSQRQGIECGWLRPENAEDLVIAWRPEGTEEWQPWPPEGES